MEENKQRNRTLDRVGKQHLRNLRSIHDQHRLHVQAVQDQHDEQLQAIQANGRLSPTKFNQVQDELRRVELLNHNKKVKVLERKNTDLETMYARMVTMMDRVVDSQDNQHTCVIILAWSFSCSMFFFCSAIRRCAACWSWTAPASENIKHQI